jgi:hypothetical protein
MAAIKASPFREASPFSGEPEEIRPNEEITLTSARFYNDFGVDVSKFLKGGYLAYCYRINHKASSAASGSAEYPISRPLTLSLAEEGIYFLEVSGKINIIGMWDHDPVWDKPCPWPGRVPGKCAPMPFRLELNRGILRLNELSSKPGLSSSSMPAQKLSNWKVEPDRSSSIPGRVGFGPGSVPLSGRVSRGGTGDGFASEALRAEISTSMAR